MKRVIFITILLFANRLEAQWAGDPNAIDLRTIMQVIDTSTSTFNPNDNLTVGDLNGDGFDDMMFGNNNSCSLHLGGPFILQPQNYPMLDQFAVGHGAFRTQGLQDLITTPTGVDLYYDSNLVTLPYYTVRPNATFSFSSYLPYIGLVSVIDYDGDGIPDVIATSSPILGHGYDYILLYRGGHDVPYHVIFDTAEGPMILPSDSIIFPSAYRYYGITVASFGKNLPPMICFAEADTGYHTRIGVIRNGRSLSQDSIVWISNSDSDGVNARQLYSMDITGDGVDDLLVSDGDSIFIYNGNDNFGNYQLTRHNAYYIIKSPKFMDLQFELMAGFGGYMHTCGDLTGSGVPVLMTTGQIDDHMGGGRTIAFFYCGGKALDSLYDAIYSETRFAGFTIDTLNAVDGSRRNACVFQSSQSSGTNYLLYKDADKIPHRTNPNLGGVHSVSSSPNVTMFPSIANQFIKIDMDGIPFSARVSVKVLNILGALELSQELTDFSGSYEQEFDVSGLENGVYIAVIEWEGGERAIRFVIQR